MSNEPPVSLRDYVDTRVDSVEHQLAATEKLFTTELASAARAVTAALAAADRAVAKAEESSDKRFDGVNEFRGQLADQTRTLIPRLEAETKFNSIEASMKLLTDRMNQRDSRADGMGRLWATMIGIIGMVGILISLALAFTKTT